MALVHYRIDKREPYCNGQTFGSVGPFELIDGVAQFAVDPAAEANRQIIDIGNAPRDERGMVTFESRIMVVTPVEQEESDRKVLLDVPNRGRRLTASFNRVPRDEAVENPLAPGDGFLFRRGFTTMTVGWQWDLNPGEGFWLNAPVAYDQGETITGDVVSRLQPARDTNTLAIGQLGKACYPPVDPDAPTARLFHQRDPNSPLEEIVRDEWQFGAEKDGTIEPSQAHIYRRNGFEAGHHYVLVYQSGDPRVAGVGLLAVRDAAIALRQGVLLEGRRFPAIHAYGASQTGRFLRHFLYLGLNRGEDGARALDGVIAHIAGGQRLDVNHRFAQPSSPAVPGPALQFPFSTADQTDPISARQDSLLRRCRDAGVAPKVMLTNSAWEYWRGDASLIHTTPDGQRDAPVDEDTRIYLFAGAQHISGSLPHVNRSPLGVKGRYGFSVVDFNPLMRAALVNLDAWVREGKAPPASAYPTFEDATAATRADVLEAFGEQSDVHLLDPDQLPKVHEPLLKEGAARGIIDQPVDLGDERQAIVSAVDEDGNEIAGVRLPDISVPVGVHTGWNPRHPDMGAPEQPIAFMGFTRFFDPQEIGGRYGSRESYHARVRKAAEALRDTHYLLDEDIEHVIANAMARFDAAMAGEAI